MGERILARGNLRQQSVLIRGVVLMVTSRCIWQGITVSWSEAFESTGRDRTCPDTMAGKIDKQKARDCGLFVEIDTNVFGSIPEEQLMFPWNKVRNNDVGSTGHPAYPVLVDHRVKFRTVVVFHR